MIYPLPTLAATQSLAEVFAANVGLLTGQSIHLHGDLGAGKTTFVRFLLQALGEQGSIKSPTYGLMEHYSLPGIQVLHMDLYRLADAEELEYLGVRELKTDNTLLLVEWPERGVGVLPEADCVIEIQHTQAQRCADIELKNSNSPLAQLVLFRQ